MIQNKILPKGQTVHLGVGSKGQISLNFFESVMICNGAPLTVCSSYLLL